MTKEELFARVAQLNGCESGELIWLVSSCWFKKWEAYCCQSGEAPGDVNKDLKGCLVKEAQILQEHFDYFYQGKHLDRIPNEGLKHFTTPAF